MGLEESRPSGLHLMEKYGGQTHDGMVDQRLVEVEEVGRRQ